MKYKNIIASGTAIVGGFVASYLGEYTLSMSVLFTLMVADFALGILGALCQKSLKTDNGGVSSKASFIGLAKKLTIIIFVGIGYNLDLLLDTGILNLTSLF